MLRSMFRACIRLAWLSLGLLLFLLLAGRDPVQLIVNLEEIGSKAARMTNIENQLEVSTKSTADADHDDGLEREMDAELQLEMKPEIEEEQDAADEGRSPEEQPFTAQTPSVYEVIATGYYAGVESTGKSPGHPEYGITYSGIKARRGTLSTIAADLNLFPIGTVLYIPDYGYGVVADIGSAVKGNIIDLYFPTKEEIYRLWGKRVVQVTVIEEGDGHLDEEKLRRLEAMLGASDPPSAL